MSYFKVISLGHIVEVYEYEKKPFTSEDNYTEKTESKLEWIRELESKTKEEYQRSNSVRTRNMIRRLCLANFDNGSKFITLTFRKHITDLNEANREFKKYIQRLRYKYGKFKYIAVIEFMKNGRIHYHMMSDLPYIPNAKLAEIWENGYVKINDIHAVDNVGAYMVKYMIKDVSDDRLAGRKAYLCSKNLERPLEFKGEVAEKIIEEYNLKTKKEVFTNSYESEYIGNITYREFNLKR